VVMKSSIFPGYTADDFQQATQRYILNDGTLQLGICLTFLKKRRGVIRTSPKSRIFLIKLKGYKEKCLVETCLKSMMDL
jgi:hypothetical protein